MCGWMQNATCPYTADAALGQGMAEDGQEVGPMNGDEDGAEAIRDVAAALLTRDNPSATPTAYDLIIGLKADGDGLVFDTERAKCLHGVGAEIQPGTDFAKLGGLFVDHGFDSATAQRQAGRETAKSSADDRGSRRSWHGENLKSSFLPHHALMRQPCREIIGWALTSEECPPGARLNDVRRHAGIGSSNLHGPLNEFYDHMSPWAVF